MPCHAAWAQLVESHRRLCARLAQRKRQSGKRKPLETGHTFATTNMGEWGSLRLLDRKPVFVTRNKLTGGHHGLPMQNGNPLPRAETLGGGTIYETAACLLRRAK